MKKKVANLSMLIMACFLFFSCADKKKEWTVVSPSGNLRMVVQMDALNQMIYQVDLVDGENITPVLSPSSMGINREDQSFVKNLKLVEASELVAKCDSFTLVTGKQKAVATGWNERTLIFENENGAFIEVIVRVQNDGIAFRYRFPETDANIFTITEELTGFCVAGNGKKWLQPYDNVTNYSPGYERYFENGVAIGTNAPGPEGWAFPALFQTESAWLLLTEAAVDGSYFAAHLQPESEGGRYSIRMPETEEAFELYSSKPSSTLPWATPWRVLIVGKSLADVVESNMVVELNPASAISDPSWIKPGRSSWSWWGDWPSPKDYNALTKFVDFSAEMGWEYTLVDANWDLMEGGTIEQLVQYASAKNVGILMWYNSGGPHNVVTERPRDIMNDPEKRKEEFKKLAAWGVKGVKVDFFQSDKQEIIQQYFGILEDAANNKIMVNFHGCTLPRGWNRTWPNFVTSEAVRGAESYAFDSIYPQMAVVQNTILPFTRNVVGSMDFTPVTFSNQRYAHLTSFAHELALSVVFESGIVHMADRIDPYRALPEAPRTFLENLPVTWDASRLLEGYPGEKCVMARQNNGVWYIGGINGTDQAQTWEIDLSRLSNQVFSANIIADGETNTEFANTSIDLNPGDKLKVSVLPRGGFVATLTKQ